MAITPSDLQRMAARRLMRTPTARPAKLGVMTLEDRVTPAGVVTGVVFQDFNSNGAIDTATSVLNSSGSGGVSLAVDRGLPGATVSAYDAGGVLRGTATTAADGSYTLNATGTGPYRIEFTGLPTGTFFGPTGASANSAVQFIPDGNSPNVNLAVVRPEDYSVNNPLLVTSVYVADAFNGGNAARDVIQSFPYSSGAQDGDPNRQNYQNPTTHQLGIRHDQVGSTWGLSYDRATNTVLAAAHMKRHTGFGPNGPGAIYRAPTAGTTASLFVDLNAVFGDLPAGNLNDLFRDGSNVGFRNLPNNNAGWNYDFDGNVNVTDAAGVAHTVGWDAVGKLALGGLDTTPDGGRSFTVALGDRRLYSIPMSGPLTAATVQRFDLPIPASVTGRTAGNPLGDLRPYAVQMHRGIVYVGAVNTAESTQNPADLRAYVFAFDPARGQFVNLARQATSTEAVFDISLNYPRGIAHPAGELNTNTPDPTDVFPPDPARWNPWSPIYRNNAPDPQGNGRITYPQPMLTGITFDVAGNMVLGIRDRLGDQAGRSDGSNPTFQNSLGYFGIPSGDTLRAFVNAPGNLDLVALPTGGANFAGWTLENNARGPNGEGTGPQNTGQGPGGGEFYFADNLPRNTQRPPLGIANDHDDVTVGGVLQLPGFPEVATTAFDPVRLFEAYNSGGVRWFTNSTGNILKAYELFVTQTANTTFAKANGVGDLIAVTQASPIEIGNFVWLDVNGNGTQDPGETPLGGVEVQLTGPAGELLGTATTDAAGNYYFSAAPGTSTTNKVFGLNLRPNTQYQVRVPLAQAALAGRLLTGVNAAGGANADQIDSDATVQNGFAVITLTTGPIGRNDHTFDIGFNNPQVVALGDFVWEDANNNGYFDNSEFPIDGVTVNLYDASGTNLLATATTANGGAYLFPNLTPGTYLVEVIPPAGFISSTGPNNQFENITGNSLTNNEDHGNQQPGGPIRGTPVTVAPPINNTNPDRLPGSPLPDANLRQDFGLWRPLAVGDLVWEDINNDGDRDAAEPGIDGVLVQLLDSVGNVIGNQTTANGGAYLFDGLFPGTYQVRITPPAGYRSSTGRNGADTGPFEPGTTANNNNEDHGTAAGQFIVAGPIGLAFGNAVTVDRNGTANLRQDFGLFRPLAVGDTVFLDANNNGQCDTGEPGIAGVTVRLLDGAGTVLAVTTTNANGQYRFGNLSPNTYQVEIVPPAGFLSSTGTGPNSTAGGAFEPAPQTSAECFDNGTTTAAGTIRALPITLGLPGSAENPSENGLANLTEDFGLYQFVPPVPLAIGDTVFLDANNNGRCDTGEPGVAGVTVRLLNITGTVLATTTTNASGQYRFDNLSEGSYQVEIVPPAGFLSSTGTGPSSTAGGAYEPAPQTSDECFDNGTFDAATGTIRALPVTLGPAGSAQNPSENGRANLTEDFGLYQFVPPPQPGSVSGYVFNDCDVFDGQRDLAGGEVGIGGVRITLSGTDSQGNPIAVRTTATDPSGFYRFTDLPAGNYTIRETQPGLRYDGPDSVGSLGGANPANDTLTLPLPAGGAGTDYNFGELTGGSAFGYIYDDRNRDRQNDAGDRGIAGVAFTISGTAFAGTPQARLLTAADIPGGLTVLSDARGRWEFPVVPPGEYSISQITPPGLQDDLTLAQEPIPGGRAVFTTNAITNMVIGCGETRGALNFPKRAPQLPPDPTKRNFLGSTVNTGGGVVTDPTPGNGVGSPQNVPLLPAFTSTTGTPTRPEFVVAAAGAGRAPLVRVLDFAGGSERLKFYAYETGFTGGVRTAVGDVDGDGTPDIITGIGVGGGPRIRVFSGVDGAPIRDFFAYEPTFTGGLFVAAGDLNGDGKADIITGVEVGGGPRVQVFDGATGASLLNFFAFDGGQRGGVRVAAADFNADGRADIVATTGVGVVTRVRVFDGTNAGLLGDFAPYTAGFTGGVYVAAGDVDGDGRPDIVTGADTGGGPNVRVFSGLSGQLTSSIFAYEPNMSGGVRVSLADVNGDGRQDVVTAPGPGGAGRVRIWRGADLQPLDSFFAFDTTFTGGVYIG